MSPHLRFKATRLLFSSRWRAAHAHELPTRQQLFVMALVFVTLSVSPYVARTADLQAELLDSIGVEHRVLSCLNGKTTLGDVHTTSDGKRWVTKCQFYEELVK